jgi:hypothetical protein
LLGILPLDAIVLCKLPQPLVVVAPEPVLRFPPGQKLDAGVQVILDRLGPLFLGAPTAERS